MCGLQVKLWTDKARAGKNYLRSAQAIDWYSGVTYVWHLPLESRIHSFIMVVLSAVIITSYSDVINVTLVCKLRVGCCDVELSPAILRCTDAVCYVLVIKSRPRLTASPQ